MLSVFGLVDEGGNLYIIHVQGMISNGGTKRVCHNIIVENLEDEMNITYNPQIQRWLLTFCVCPSIYLPMCTTKQSHTSV